MENNLVQFSFLNKIVFMIKKDITGIIDEEWFLKTILEAEYFVDNENNKNKIEINEDKNTACFTEVIL